MQFTSDQLARARVRAHFRGWVNEVKQANGLLVPIPDKLLDSLDEGLDAYVADELINMGLHFESTPSGSGWNYR